MVVPAGTHPSGPDGVHLSGLVSGLADMEGLLLGLSGFAEASNLPAPADRHPSDPAAEVPCCPGSVAAVAGVWEGSVAVVAGALVSELVVAGQAWEAGVRVSGLAVPLVSGLVVGAKALELAV